MKSCDILHVSRTNGDNWRQIEVVWNFIHNNVSLFKKSVDYDSFKTFLDLLLHNTIDLILKNYSFLYFRLNIPKLITYYINLSCLLGSAVPYQKSRQLPRDGAPTSAIFHVRIVEAYIWFMLCKQNSFFTTLIKKALRFSNFLWSVSVGFSVIFVKQ